MNSKEFERYYKQHNKEDYMPLRYAAIFSDKDPLDNYIEQRQAILNMIKERAAEQEQEQVKELAAAAADEFLKELEKAIKAI